MVSRSISSAEISKFAADSREKDREAAKAEVDSLRTAQQPDPPAQHFRVKTVSFDQHAVFAIGQFLRVRNVVGDYWHMGTFAGVDPLLVEVPGLARDSLRWNLAESLPEGMFPRSLEAKNDSDVRDD